MSNQTLTFLAALGLLAPVYLVSLYLKEAPLTPHPQLVKPSARSQDRVDASSRTRLGMVVNWARTVLASEGNPSAVVWKDMLANRDGTRVCLAYRTGSEAALRRVSFISSAQGSSRGGWEEACNGDLAPVTEARQWIAR